MRERLARKYKDALAALGLEPAASLTPRRPVLYIDMDNTLVDFASAFPRVDKRILRGSVLYKRLILSHHKDLNHGALLVDDRPHKNGAAEFDGIVVPFGHPNFPDWTSFVDWLMKADVAA